MGKHSNEDSPPPTIQLLNEVELSKLLGCSRAKLQRDRYIGIGIPFIKSAGKRGLVRYDIKEVNAWLDKHKRTSTSQED